MKRYIHGQRNGIYIIDLQQTLKQLYKAYALVRNVAENGGNVLFVGTKRQAQESVQNEAKRCGMYYVTTRWLGGMLTNFKTVTESIRELERLQNLEETGQIEQYPKKEAILMRKHRVKLEKNLLGIQKMPGLPQVMFVVDASREDIAVKEAHRLNIPCIGIVDTNCDPDVVDLPIPGNDDAIRAVQMFCSVIADAVIEGRMRGEKRRADERAAAKDQVADDADKMDAAILAGTKEEDESEAAMGVDADVDTNADSGQEEEA